MAEAYTFAYFDENAHTKIITDASPVGLGAVLVQERSRTVHGHRYVMQGRQ